jgi:phenylalanyl-tRNA synthetase beta chain
MDQEDTTMPIITLERTRFSKFLKQEPTLKEMTDWLPWLGFDVEEIGEDYVKVEFNPNRIDFSSYVGVARAYKGLRGLETGLPEYSVNDGQTILNVDRLVSEVRPFMLAAVVRDINLDGEDVNDLMEMQEDLHWVVGRDRKKASIGIHNLDVVTPPFTFTAVEPESVKFLPLDKTEQMSPAEILQKHEKGIAYKHLVDRAPRFPLLVDREKNVLSMPPIINGELTRIDKGTTNLFLDVTGTDYAAVQKSLRVLCTSLSDMEGTIEKVQVEYPDRTVTSPDLSPWRLNLRTSYVNKLLGLKLSDQEIIDCLRKCRMAGKRVRKNVVQAEIPAYRIDILHEVDLVEEVAIGYGYFKLRPTFPSSVTVGRQHPSNKIATRARMVMIGLGFTEVMNFTITNEAVHSKKMRRRLGKPVTLANPVSSEYTIMRQDLLPGLISNLSTNKHESYPQLLFEVSDVVLLNETLQTRCERRLHLAGASSHATADFTEIKSSLEALIRNMTTRNWELVAVEHPSFVNGRAASISLRGARIGCFGEIHPEVLNNFDLANPTGAFEIDLEALMQ